MNLVEKHFVVVSVFSFCMPHVFPFMSIMPHKIENVELLTKTKHMSCLCTICIYGFTIEFLSKF